MTTSAPDEPIDGVTDAALLYQLSGLLDITQDTAQRLLALPQPAAEVTATLAARYAEIVSRLPKALTEEQVEDLRTWVPTELPAGATLAQVYDAVATADRWVDLVFGTPVLLANHAQRQFEVRTVLARLKQTPEQGNGVRSDPVSDGPGQYL